MAKAPAFQFYVADYESDENVKLMSLAQEGAYLRLLCHQWLHRSIPNEIAALARICRVPKARMANLWPGISPCFKPSSNGRLSNPRMSLEKDRLQAFHEERAASGRKGNAAKRRASSVDIEVDAERTLSARPSSSTSSSNEHSPLPPPPEGSLHRDKRAMDVATQYLKDFWIRLGGYVDRDQVREIHRRLKAGQPAKVIEAWISDRRRDELVKAGTFDENQPWPPTEVAS